MHLFKEGGNISWKLGEHCDSPTLCTLPHRAGLAEAETLLLPLLCLESPHGGHMGEPATAPENPSEAQRVKGAEGVPKASLSSSNSSLLLWKMRVRNGDWTEVG